jgi:exodeoxyribonuclease VII small subunit
MPKRPTNQPQVADEPGAAARAFEDGVQELEGIVSALEKGDLPLEDALKLHARGQELAAACAKQLDEAELKLRQLQPES